MAEALNRDAIFAAAAKAETAAVLVKEWGGSVHLRQLTAAERDALDRETVRRSRKDKERVRFRERLLIACAVHPDGTPLFTAEDEDRLSGMPVAGLDRLYRVAVRMNGFGDEDEDDAGN